MNATFADGRVDRITVGEPDCAAYAALLAWRDETPGLTFGYPDFHRLQLEHWIWTRLQPTPDDRRVLDIGVYDRKDWIGPGYRAFGAPDTQCDIGGDLLTPGAIGDGWDVIICAEVLEHCERPHDAVRLMHEALVPGGRLLLSSPFLWPDHRTQDYPDFWRFTEQAWHLLCRDFSTVAVTPCQFTDSGKAAYHLLRQAEGMGFAGLTYATTGYLVEAVK